MEIKNLTCINCPLGCQISVKLDGNKVVEVSGNTCKKGEEYAIKEVTNPTRIITSTVIVEGGSGNNSQVSVKTESDIPKGKIYDVMNALKGVSVKEPVAIGDVVIENVADTGVNIIVTRNISNVRK